MSTQVLASCTFERKTRDGYLVATAKCVALGEQEPYFSVTAELWDSEGWYRNGQDGRMRAGGCLHDEIVRAFPRLAPLVALHLSTVDGVPMHAEANGWYWYDGAGVDGDSAFARMTPHERAAHHLRVDPAQLPEGLDREAFAEFVQTLRPRWQAEAAAGLAFLSAESGDLVNKNVRIADSARTWRVMRETTAELLVGWTPDGGKQVRETRWVARSDAAVQA